MDHEYEQGSAHPAQDGAARMRSVGQTISTWIGAAVAMVLLLGLGTWFYHLGVRDAKQVPIIRASTEPVKVRPTEKGGEVTPHQDIASYDAGAIERSPEPIPKLAPAPPKPSAEDVAMSNLQKPEDTKPVVPLQSVAQAPDPEVIEAPTTGVMTITADEPVETIVEAVEVETGTATVEAVETVETTTEVAVLDVQMPEPAEAAVEEVAEPAVEPEVVPLTPQGQLARPASAGNEFAPDYSPRVIKRPPGLKERALTARQNAEKNAEEDANKLASLAAQSKIKVQLLASPIREEIVSSWEVIRKKHADIVGKKALSLEDTKSGGTTFYRLRVGPFRDRAEANAVCLALKARGQDCIVTADG
ncbi:SPOR domain-containing protein [Rhodobacteraceae bacterium NNCM2]|nr:SPOR domain-containing protein [Coraliihabitans acroporae]